MFAGQSPTFSAFRRNRIILGKGWAGTGTGWRPPSRPLWRGSSTAGLYSFRCEVRVTWRPECQTNRSYAPRNAKFSLFRGLRPRPGGHLKAQLDQTSRGSSGVRFWRSGPGASCARGGAFELRCGTELGPCFTRRAFDLASARCACGWTVKRILVRVLVKCPVGGFWARARGGSYVLLGALGLRRVLGHRSANDGANFRPCNLQP
jgi:hypothetical protein